MTSRAPRIAAPLCSLLLLLGAASPSSGADPCRPRAASRPESVAAPAAGAAQSPTTSLPGGHGAFGFRLGEQRRYTLGPDDVLRPGEFEIWTLRLEEQFEQAGEQQFRFSYSYEYARIDPRNPEEPESYLGQASVVVNGWGFPLEIEYGANRFNGVTTGGTGHNGRVVWVNSEFFVELPEHRGPWGYSFDLPSHDELDQRVPSGLYISESDNPALITFPAAVFQATGVTEMEFLVLRPDFIGSGRGIRNPGRRRDVVDGKLEFEEIEQIEVGGRSYEAVRLDSRETEGDIYVRQDGMLLLLEKRHRNRNAHVRLLHPSEY